MPQEQSPYSLMDVLKYLFKVQYCVSTTSFRGVNANIGAAPAHAEQHEMYSHLLCHS